VLAVLAHDEVHDIGGVNVEGMTFEFELLENLRAQ
jgi:hypothetical protein